MLATSSTHDTDIWRHKFSSQKLYYFFICIAFIIIVASLALSMTIMFMPISELETWIEDRGAQPRPNLSIKNEFLKIPIVWILSLFPENPTPRITLDIKFEHLERLKTIRARALEERVYIQREDDFVPGKLRLDDRTIKIKLRLKGDWTDHLKGDKWAFRVHVKGKDHVFGIRRFSLHHPQGRDYQGEPVFFEILRKEGILTPRYFFVDVILNGENLGLMAFEEHFSQELLEEQGRKASVILRFDETLVWKALDGLDRGFRGVYDNYTNNKILPFRATSISKSPRLSQDLKMATGLLRGFTQGILHPSEVFDAELYGRFLAISDVWGTWHTLAWNNLRFYYNPLTAHIEPIAFDANTGDTFSAPRLILGRRHAGPAANGIVASLLQDPKIFQAYIDTLTRLKTKLKTGDLEKTINKAQLRYLRQLWRDYPFARMLNVSEFLPRTEALLNAFDQRKNNSWPERIYPKYLHAYQSKVKNLSQLELINAIPSTLEIISIDWVDEKQGTTIPLQSIKNITFPFDLLPTPKRKTAKINNILYGSPFSTGKTNYALFVSHRIKGNSTIYKTKATQYYPPLTKPIIPDTQPEELLKNYNFLYFDKIQNLFRIKPGTWKISKHLIFPQGLGVNIPAGVTLKFSKNAALTVQGPFMAEGTSQEPVILEGQSRKNSIGTWQGMAVLQAASPSSLSHVIFRNTTGINQNGWKLTGGVTFYKSDVQLHDCQFIGNQTEDALNIVQSNFALNNVQIIDAISDGFDADFTTGKIENGTFRNIGGIGGGDAIDISGSKVSLIGTQFFQVNDKAISVGENSKLSAENLTFKEVNVGAASKDGSTLYIKNSKFTGAKHASLMAYTKKPEYGPAKIKAENLHFDSKFGFARAQKGSSIILDGSEIETEDIDVKSLYQTTMKPGLER